MPATTTSNASVRKAVPARIEGLERFAWLMDRAFTIPGTNIKVGLDALIGLLPFGGDAVTGLLQAGLVLVAITRYNVPKAVAGRMIANVLLDTVLGSIPVLGDLFDASFKANTRNVQLLREHTARQEFLERAPAHPQAAGSKLSDGWGLPSRRSLVGMVIGFVLILAILIAALVALFLWMIVKLSGHPLI
jgi:hypothetical protein